MTNEYEFDLEDDEGDDFLDLSTGVCRSCGCTEDAACPGGCVWATPNADLCSRCARGNG